jgi:hypothetical protein
MSKIYGQLEKAQIENVGALPTAGVKGRVVFLTTDSKVYIDDGSNFIAVDLISQTQTLTNKTLTGNTAVNLISGSGTLTLNTSGTATVPNATDTLVGKATTDTLTNKTLTGNTAVNLISGSGTLTLNTSGTATVPNGTDTLVAKNTTDTLTNKTLTAPVIATIVSGAGTNTLPTATGTLLSTAAAVTIAQGGTGQITKAPAFDALSPTATAGDIIVRGASANVAQAIGTDGQVLVVDTTQTNKLKWTSLQQGTKNYITYNNFENNATTGWSLVHSAITSLVPTTVATATNSFSSAGGAHGGSAANGNLSISAVSSGKLAGSFSLSMVASSATIAGDMLISDAYTLDIEDQAKVMQFSFYYSPTVNPSNANWSGTSANTFQVWIYDVTNAAWIQPAGVYNMVQSSGVGLASGTWQTPSNMTQFQIAVISIVASSGAITILSDDFFVGPQKVVYGSPVTDWVAFTPTGSWSTNTTYSGFWRRVGDSAEYKVHIALAGAPTSAGLTVNLPSGHVIDTAKVVSTNNGVNMVGIAKLNDNGVDQYLGDVSINNTTSVAVYSVRTVTGSNPQYLDHPQVTQAVPITWGNADTIELEIYNIPVVGWSSSVQMSNDTDTRVVACNKTGNNSVTGTLSGSDSIAIFTSVSNDTHAGYNVSTGVYTVPVSGYYRCKFTTEGTSNVAANNALTASIYKNAATLYSSATVAGATVTGQDLTATVTGTALFNAGDTIDFRAKMGGASQAYATTFNGNSFSIERLSGPSAIAASETVAMDYGNTASSTIGTSATVIPFNTKNFDSHSGFVTDTYTIPVSGKYLVSTVISSSPVSLTTGQNLSVFLNKGGTAFASIQINGNGASATYSGSLSRAVSCVAGNTITVSASASAATTTNGSANYNYVSIERIGN